MIDGFALKKIISLFLHLVPGLFFFLFASLLLRRWWPRTGNFLAMCVCITLLAASSPVLSNFFISQLENRFPVLVQAPADTVLILVLGSGHSYISGRPANSVLTSVALSRLIEGVRLWKTKPDSYLALSGANFGNEISHAEAMKRMAVQLGVRQERIVLFDQNRDTAEEIKSAFDYLGVLQKSSTDSENSLVAGRLVVTSSGYHLPRASLLLNQYDLTHSLAPTEFRAREAAWYRMDSYFLRNLSMASHEWFGIAWIRLRSLI